MDNIIQVIVILIIIWSILGSALKKKPQTPAQKVARRIPGEGNDNPSSGYSKSSQDVLEEILGFRIPQPTDDETNYQMEDSTKNSYEEKSEQIQYPTIPDVNYDKQASLETADSKLLRVDLHKQYLEKVYVTGQREEIRKKIKDRATLRDAILINEILNKPKALRK